MIDSLQPLRESVAATQAALTNPNLAPSGKPRPHELPTVNWPELLLPAGPDLEAHPDGDDPEQGPGLPRPRRPFPMLPTLGQAIGNAVAQQSAAADAQSPQWPAPALPARTPAISAGRHMAEGGNVADEGAAEPKKPAVAYLEGATVVVDFPDGTRRTMPESRFHAQRKALEDQHGPMEVLDRRAPKTHPSKRAAKKRTAAPAAEGPPPPAEAAGLAQPAVPVEPTVSDARGDESAVPDLAVKESPVSDTQGTGSPVSDTPTSEPPAAPAAPEISTAAPSIADMSPRLPEPPRMEADIAAPAPEQPGTPPAELSATPAAEASPSAEPESKGSDATPAITAPPAPADLPSPAAMAGTASPPAELPTTAGDALAQAAAPWDGGKPDYDVRYMAPTEKLLVNPERFQFKQDVNKKGVTDEFKETAKWEPDFAGILLAWQDPADRQTYIVNGHHRHELAERLDVPQLPIKYIEAASAEEARAKGALANIAEGRGTAMDAAKFMRDTQLGPQDMAERGVSIKGKVAADAVELTKLNDRLFHQVARGQLPQETAIAMARHLPDHHLQDQLAAFLARKETAGKEYAPKIVESMAREMAETPKHTTVEHTLFGDLENEDSLFGERNELKTAVRADLSKSVSDFRAVASERRASVVEAAGNILDVDQNKKKADENAQVLALFDTLVNSKGSISDALNQGALEYAQAKGKKAKDAARSRTLDAVRAAVEREAQAAYGGREGPPLPLAEGLPADAAGDARAEDAQPGSPGPDGLSPEHKAHGGPVPLPEHTPDPAHWAAALAEVPPGELHHVGGLPVRRLDQDHYRIDTDTGHVTGPAAQVAQHIAQDHQARALEGKPRQLALERAGDWTPPDEFADPERAQHEAAGFAALPHGARVVSLHPDTYGRMGIIRRGDDGNQVHLDGSPIGGSSYVEPVDPRLSFRAPSSLPAGAAADLFSGDEAVAKPASRPARGRSMRREQAGDLEEDTADFFAPRPEQGRLFMARGGEVPYQPAALPGSLPEAFAAPGGLAGDKADVGPVASGPPALPASLPEAIGAFQARPASKWARPDGAPYTPEDIDRVRSRKDLLELGRSVDNAYGDVVASLGGLTFAGMKDNLKQRLAQHQQRNRPEPGAGAAHGPGSAENTGDLHQDLHAAMRSLGGEAKRIRLADLKDRLTGHAPSAIDQALRDLAEADHVSLYRLDDPREVQDRDRAAALPTSTGDSKHLLYYGGAGKSIEHRATGGAVSYHTPEPLPESMGDAILGSLPRWADNRPDDRNDIAEEPTPIGARFKSWMEKRYGKKTAAAASVFGQAATWAGSAAVTAATGTPFMLPIGTGLATAVLTAEVIRETREGLPTVGKFMRPFGELPMPHRAQGGGVGPANVLATAEEVVVPPQQAAANLPALEAMRQGKSVDPAAIEPAPGKAWKVEPRLAPPGSDDEPIRAQPGSFVLPVSAVRKNPEAVAALTGDHKAAGGSVDQEAPTLRAPALAPLPEAPNLGADTPEDHEATTVKAPRTPAGAATRQAPTQRYPSEFSPVPLPESFEMKGVTRWHNVGWLAANPEPYEGVAAIESPGGNFYSSIDFRTGKNRYFQDLEEAHDFAKKQLALEYGSGPRTPAPEYVPYAPKPKSDGVMGGMLNAVRKLFGLPHRADGGDIPHLPELDPDTPHGDLPHQASDLAATTPATEGAAHRAAGGHVSAPTMPAAIPGAVTSTMTATPAVPAVLPEHTPGLASGPSGEAVASQEPGHGAGGHLPVVSASTSATALVMPAALPEQTPGLGAPTPDEPAAHQQASHRADGGHVPAPAMPAATAAPTTTPAALPQRAPDLAGPTLGEAAAARQAAQHEELARHQEQLARKTTDPAAKAAHQAEAKKQRQHADAVRMKLAATQAVLAQQQTGPAPGPAVGPALDTRTPAAIGKPGRLHQPSYLEKLRTLAPDPSAIAAALVGRMVHATTRQLSPRLADYLGFDQLAPAKHAGTEPQVTSSARPVAVLGPGHGAIADVETLRQHGEAENKAAITQTQGGASTPAAEIQAAPTPNPATPTAGDPGRMMLPESLSEATTNSQPPSKGASQPSYLKQLRALAPDPSTITAASAGRLIHATTRQLSPRLADYLGFDQPRNRGAETQASKEESGGRPDPKVSGKGLPTGLDNMRELFGDSPQTPSRNRLPGWNNSEGGIGTPQARPAQEKESQLIEKMDALTKAIEALTKVMEQHPKHPQHNQEPAAGDKFSKGRPASASKQEKKTGVDPTLLRQGAAVAARLAAGFFSGS